MTAPRKPLVVELYCGTFGWAAGWLAMGGQAIGFDLEHLPHHGPIPAGAELVLQDVRTLHGRQFKDAALILASPPCQEFSYRAMPWKRAKALPPPVLGMALFAACFRIQREASEAAGRHIPMVVENVCGAQKWVGRARWHYGSYYLWGDVPALMPFTDRGLKAPKGALTQPLTATGAKQLSPHWRNKTYLDGAKNTGGSWFRVANNTTSGVNNNAAEQLAAGIKGGGDWFSDPASPSRRSSSRSNARRAASALIARIPDRLSQHIAEVYYPHEGGSNV